MIESDQQSSDFTPCGLDRHQTKGIQQPRQIQTNETQNTVKSLRNSRMEGIRSRVKTMTIINTNTSKIEEKMERQKKRRESLQIPISENHLLCPIEINLQQSDDSQYSSPLQPHSPFDEKYEMLEKIGEGVHGVVKKCRHKIKGTILAVKLIKLSDEQIPILKRNFADIRDLKHKNIVEHKALYFDYPKNLCYLVMQYTEMPDLSSIVIRNEQELKQIARQIVDALQYMHSRGLCHRDIKPDNILYDPVKKAVKLIDFGICKNLHSRGRFELMLTVTGTLYYRAPQMFHGGGYDEKVDMWALGVTLYKLITGETPFESAYLSEIIENIQSKELYFEEEHFKGSFSLLTIDFIKRLLVRDKNQRLNSKQAKNHFCFEAEPKKLEDAKDITRSLSIKACQPKSLQQSSRIADETNKENCEETANLDLIGSINMGPKDCQEKKKWSQPNSKQKGIIPSFSEKSKVRDFFQKIEVVQEDEFGSDREYDQ